ncbi:MAG: zinc-dependent metalloprotease family protein, partial [Planctomycetota bacterium]
MSLLHTMPLAASIAIGSVAGAATDSIAFDPAAFLEVAVGDPMPKDLMALDVREMTLASRHAEQGGVFYVFEDASNQGLHATLHLREGRLTGSVYGHGTAVAVIRSVEPGFSTVAMVDGANRAPCACHAGGLPQLPGAQSKRAEPGDGGVAGVCDNGGTVDVLLVYTDSAVAEAGSAQQVEDAIAWAMADANLALSSSQTGAQFRVVGVQRLAGYAEAISLVGELGRMQAGQVPGLAALRDATKADLVAMVTSEDPGVCGVAYLLPQNNASAANSGFSVSALPCLATRVLTHELGHNFGCGHAPTDPEPVGIFAYSRGHNFSAGGVAYGTALANTGQIVPRYSNPLVFFNGQPTGITGQRNNALTIFTTKLSVANFRCDADGLCGGGGSCYDGGPFNQPACSNSACCASVCAQRPECCTVAWDDACALIALDICTDCGAPSAGSCFEARATPACNDASCCTQACIADAFCCDQSWDATCVAFAAALCVPQCGDPGTGSCFTAHANPVCTDAQCCTAVCALDPLCCSAAWDASCAAAAAANCAGCGNPNAGGCLTAHATPYCADQSCCQQVCSQDDFCCNTEWDALCASAALQSCSGCGTGLESCFVPHATPSCGDYFCCMEVCVIDISCCDSAWDAGCVAAANARCGAQCGDPNLQPCSQTSAGPYCQNAQCCQVVCAIDPTCCQTAWDEGCVAATAQACTACSTAGDCNANGVPDDCDIAGGSASDANQNGVPDQCECIGDLDGNGSVNAADLAGILNAWGPVTGANAAADLDGSGTVNAADLAALLNAWGLCPNAVGDEAATAIDIAPGASASFNTIFKTPSPNPPENGSCQFLEWTANTRDIWYRVQTGAGGQLGVNLCDSSYDTSMVVYSVSPQGVLTRIACDDDSCQ